MAKKKSHKGQAIDLLEELGYAVGDVEKWIPGTRITKDLYGFVDLLAVGHGQTVAIQVTSDSGGNAACRVANCFASPQLPACLAAGWIVEVWAIRNEPTKAGSTVQARTIELSADGQRVTAYEGSVILPQEITHGDNH